jgi:ectoine hydroxylase-related dioxygenase (phytanoyl-CoA dioxygenase family)
LQLHDIDPKSLLYGEQEKLLVNRGILENELMVSKAKTVALPSNIVKGSEGGGGFGKKSSSSSSSSANKAAAKSHAKVLTKEGVVRIDNVLSPALADTIRQSVYTMRQESETLVQSGTLPSISRFADVLLKSNRCDMTIPIGLPWVANALSSILVDSPVGKVMEVLLGQDCILYELSSLMSDPGSQRQVVHPDTPYREEPVLYTCFVALQDIEMDMGELLTVL